MVIDDERGQLESNEAYYIHLNSEVRLKLSCIPPVNTEQHCGQIESLWECNYGRWGLGLGTEPPCLSKRVQDFV